MFGLNYLPKVTHKNCGRCGKELSDCWSWVLVTRSSLYIHLYAIVGIITSFANIFEVLG